MYNATINRKQNNVVLKVTDRPIRPRVSTLLVLKCSWCFCVTPRHYNKNDFHSSKFAIPRIHADALRMMCVLCVYCVWYVYCIVMWGAGSLRQWQKNIHGDQLRPRRPPSNFYNAPRQSESKCVLCVRQVCLHEVIQVWQWSEAVAGKMYLVVNQR